MSTTADDLAGQRDRQVADALLSGLFVASDSVRQRTLLDNVARLDRIGRDQLAPALELHGILPLVARHLRQVAKLGSRLEPGGAAKGDGPPGRVPDGAGAEGASIASDASVVPEDLSSWIEQLGARAEELRSDGHRFSFTRQRIVDALGEKGIPVILLKGASLLGTTYDEAGLRSQGDLDLMVQKKHLTRAVAAIESAGCVVAETQLPNWWYRATHFHLKLAPVADVLVETELHWELHAPSLLCTVTVEELWERAVARPEFGDHVFDLDPCDRLLHLVTHLLSHWRGLPGPPDRDLLAALAVAKYPTIRLKWIVDLVGELEQRVVDGGRDRLHQRAVEWHGAVRLGWTLRLLANGVPVTAGVRRWIESIAPELAPGQPWPKATAAVDRSQLPKPLPGLDFSIEAFRQLPEWFWPPCSFVLAVADRSIRNPKWRRKGWSPERVRDQRHYPWLHRAFIPFAVIAVLFIGAMLLPFAWAGRWILKGARRRRRNEACAPDRVFSLIAAARRHRA